MTNTTKLARALALGALLLITGGIASCSADQQATFTSAMQNESFSRAFSIRSTTGVSDSVLAALRNCESHGNYRAVSASGTYRGAYQFSKSTWNNVAGSVMPGYKGTDPIDAPTFIQDAMARALWSRTGPRSWPVCGRRV